MEKKLFEVTGKIKDGKLEKNFSKQINTINENTAKETVLSLFGSKNRLKRRLIVINEVKEAKVK